MLKKLNEFIRNEENASLPIFAALVFCIIVSNSPLNAFYLSVTDYIISYGFENFIISHPLKKVVNEIIMALFFLMISLEVRYQLNSGNFADKSKIIFPAYCALLGAIVPASIYLFFNYNNDKLIAGWAVTISTDTAFMLGILSFFKRIIPPNTRIFIIGMLLTDDIISISVLTLFYTKKISLYNLFIVISLVFTLMLMKKFHVKKLKYYLMVGALLWFSIFEMGVTATFSGTILSLFLPNDSSDASLSIFSLKKLESFLHVTVNYFLLPIFVFFNSGVPLSEITCLLENVNLTLGIILGLTLGKPLGILSAGIFLIKICDYKLPEGINYHKFIGISCVAGFGYIINIYVSDRIFNDINIENQIRLAVMIASLLSAIIGSLVLTLVSLKIKTS